MVEDVIEELLATLVEDDGPEVLDMLDEDIVEETVPNDADWELDKVDVEKVEAKEVALDDRDAVGVIEEELIDEKDTEDDDCKEMESVLVEDDEDRLELPEAVVWVEMSDCEVELELEDPELTLAVDAEETLELDAEERLDEIDPETRLELEARVVLELGESEVELKLDEAVLELDDVGL